MPKAVVDEMMDNEVNDKEVMNMTSMQNGDKSPNERESSPVYPVSLIICQYYLSSIIAHQTSFKSR